MTLNYDSIIKVYKNDERIKNYLYTSLNNRNYDFDRYFNSYLRLFSGVETAFFGNELKTDEEAYTKWRDKIYSVLLAEDAVNGEVLSIEDYVIETIENINDEDVITSWFNKLYFDAMESPIIKIGILHVLSHIDYKKIYPVGQMIALAGLTDPDDEVIEFSIKAFENWQDKQCVRLLKGRQLKKAWLQEYLNYVIAHLEEQNVFFPQNSDG